MRKRLFAKQLGIPVEEEIYQRIVSLSDREEIAIAQWVRDAIEAKLAKDNDHQRTKED